ncbi:MAG: general secretion pathway protein A [Hydrogenophaga sp.]|jgi:general secretion pathway protein A
MYAGFFGLQHAPFSIAPDPRYLYMSERHREALAHLLYGIEGGGGFVLLSGEIGAGKTTICRCFLEQIPAHCRVAYIFNPKLTVSDLLRTICSEFHVEVRHEGTGPATIKAYLDPLNDYLLRSHAAGEHNILIIDEAQNLSLHVMEQLRLLTNLETTERKLLQVILIGQPELREMVARPELEQLAQRVIARFHLGTLSALETRQYIAHRMAVAGLRGPLPFADKAIARVHALTGGVPRRINLLCDRALLGAYASGQHKVEREVVDKAAGEVFEPTRATPLSTDSSTQKHHTTTLGLGALGGALAAGLLLGVWTLTQPRAPVADQTANATSEAAATAPGPATSQANAAWPETTTPAPTGESPVSLPNAATAPPEASATAGAPPKIGPPPFADLLQSENAALRELGPLWGQSLPDADPCARAERERLQCFRISRMTLNGLRQLDRPAALTLRLPGQERGWALLSAMTSDTATLQVGNQRWLMPLTALADIWRGEYTTLWRQPPGQSGRLGNGNSGPAAVWATQQLERLQARGDLPASALSFDQQVRAFQEANGLEADGIAGPMTFMLINLAADVAEPRLGKASAS